MATDPDQTEEPDTPAEPILSESILASVKSMLGIEKDDTSFDQEIVIYINSAFMTLNQLGVGLPGFSITGYDETWGSYITEGLDRLQSVKPYIYLKVRLLFDPPMNSFLTDSFEKQIAEFEWRLNVQVETPILNE